jgi:hypothetical protein
LRRHKIFGTLIEGVRFAADSLVEGAGFEPSVPRLGVSSVVAPTTPTGPKGAPAQRDRCEIALASSPTSGLAADLVHTNSAQDRLLFSSICLFEPFHGAGGR